MSAVEDYMRCTAEKIERPGAWCRGSFRGRRGSKCLVEHLRTGDAPRHIRRAAERKAARKGAHITYNDDARDARQVADKLRRAAGKPAKAKAPKKTKAAGPARPKVTVDRRAQERKRAADLAEERRANEARRAEREARKAQRRAADQAKADARAIAKAEADRRRADKRAADEKRAAEAGERRRVESEKARARREQRERKRAKAADRARARQRRNATPQPGQVPPTSPKARRPVTPRRSKVKVPRVKRAVPVSRPCVVEPDAQTVPTSTRAPFAWPSVDLKTTAYVAAILAAVAVWAMVGATVLAVLAVVLIALAAGGVGVAAWTLGEAILGNRKVDRVEAAWTAMTEDLRAPPLAARAQERATRRAEQPAALEPVRTPAWATDPTVTVDVEAMLKEAQR